MKRMNVLIAVVILRSLASSAWADEAQLSKWLNEKNWPETVSYTSAIKLDPDIESSVKPLQEYHNAKLNEFRERFTGWLQGIGDLHPISVCVDELFEIRTDLTPPDADKYLEAKLEVAKYLEAQAKEIAEQKPLGQRYSGFNVHLQQVAATAYRHKVEVEVLRAHGQLPKRSN